VATCRCPLYVGRDGNSRAKPLQVDPLKINKIQVMETSKAGNVVDQRVK